MEPTGELQCENQGYSIAGTPCTKADVEAYRARISYILPRLPDDDATQLRDQMAAAATPAEQRALFEQAAQRFEERMQRAEGSGPFAGDKTPDQPVHERREVGSRQGPVLRDVVPAEVDQRKGYDRGVLLSLQSVPTATTALADVPRCENFNDNAMNRTLLGGSRDSPTNELVSRVDSGGRPSRCATETADLDRQTGAVRLLEERLNVVSRELHSVAEEARRANLKIVRLQRELAECRQTLRSRTTAETPRSPATPGLTRSTKLACFRCGLVGHFRRDCGEARRGGPRFVGTIRVTGRGSDVGRPTEPEEAPVREDTVGTPRPTPTRGSSPPFPPALPAVPTQSGPNRGQPVNRRGGHLVGSSPLKLPSLADVRRRLRERYDDEAMATVTRYVQGMESSAVYRGLQRVTRRRSRLARRIACADGKLEQLLAPQDYRCLGAVVRAHRNNLSTRIRDEWRGRIGEFEKVERPTG